MSRLTRYLKQTAVLESVVLNEDGEPVMDAYGKYQYQEPQVVKCRKEITEDIASSDGGHYVRYSYTYYVDETIPVHNDDKLDGKLVVGVGEYVDGAGQLIGYEVHV